MPHQSHPHQTSQQLGHHSTSPSSTGNSNNNGNSQQQSNPSPTSDPQISSSAVESGNGDESKSNPNSTPDGSKKEEEDGEQDPNDEGISIKMLVPNNMVGSIIGKGGTSIKDITAQTGVKIHIAQSDESILERVVTITGTLASIGRAQHQISLRMQEEAYSEVKEFESSTPISDRMSLVPLKLLVPNMVVGRLIGKGGTNLKKTMVETNTYITCSKEEELSRYTGDRIVSIIGSVENHPCSIGSDPADESVYANPKSAAHRNGPSKNTL